MTNQTFNSFDLEHATLEDFMTVETPMTDSEINDAIQYAVDYSNEIAEIELQEKLADATYPRHGYTSAQVFENEEEYEAWLREVLAEEAEEYRQDLFSMVKSASDDLERNAKLTQVMTASEAEEEFGITRDTVHKSIQSGRLPSRQSGKTHLFLRSDAVKLWKSIFIIAMFAGWLVQYLNS